MSQKVNHFKAKLAKSKKTIKRDIKELGSLTNKAIEKGQRGDGQAEEG